MGNEPWLPASVPNRSLSGGTVSTHEFFPNFFRDDSEFILHQGCGCAGGGACQVIVMGPTSFFITAAVRKSAEAEAKASPRVALVVSRCSDAFLYASFLLKRQQ